jgi:hypothetical protein
VDSHLCAEPSKYLAALLLSLTAMLHLGLPHVNVLSKMDLLSSHGPLAFSLDFYTGGEGSDDLPRLAEAVNAESRTLGRFAKLTRNLCQIVGDYNMVSFNTLDVQSEPSMRRLIAVIDKANGYAFGSLERAAALREGGGLPQLTHTHTHTEWPSEALTDVIEKYAAAQDEDT